MFSVFITGFIFKRLNNFFVLRVLIRGNLAFHQPTNNPSFIRHFMTIVTPDEIAFRLGHGLIFDPKGSSANSKDLCKGGASQIPSIMEGLAAKKIQPRPPGFSINGPVNAAACFHGTALALSVE